VTVLRRRASGGYFRAISGKDIHLPTVNMRLICGAWPEPALILRKGSNGDEMESRVMKQILSGVVVLHGDLRREWFGHGYDAVGSVCSHGAINEIEYNVCYYVDLIHLKS